MSRQKIIGRDDAGREWEGILRGNTIEWETTDSGPVLRGTETLVIHEDETMTGIETTGDVVPCTYDGEIWEGGCPTGYYKKV